MPRISPSAFWKARSINHNLYRLLPVCRDLSSARNELRWLTDHAITSTLHNDLPDGSHRALLQDYIRRRANGEPLQYILGSEYFGDLEIRCRPGVLIPRQETAAAIVHLTETLTQQNFLKTLPSPLRLLDLCTGTGCIPLLIHHELYRRFNTRDVRLEVIGIDISPTALDIAQENLALQLEASPLNGPAWTEALRRMRFVRANVFGQQQEQPAEVPSVAQALESQTRPDPKHEPMFDILISNPPYISSKAFRTTTSRSVRRFEPRLALVPDSSVHTMGHDGDLFYPRLLQLAERFSVRIVLFEVADMEQARRVAHMSAVQGIWDEIEIWRDDPGAKPDCPDWLTIAGKSVKVCGRGLGRSVFLQRDQTQTTANAS